MKLRLQDRTLLIGCLVATALTGWATPLQRADVAADPVWVLHLDCDAVRPTVVGQFLLTELDKPEVQAKFAAFQAVFNFDPRKQLHGLTLYGAGKAPEDGVLLIYADFDANRLVTLARGAKEYESTDHQGRTIHSWLDEKKPVRNGVRPRVYAAILDTRVILGQRASTVGAALDVLDNRASSLASNNTFPQLGTSNSKSFLQGAAGKLDLPQGDPNAATLKLAKRFRLEIGELQQQLSATLSIEVEDEDVAKHIASIAQGLVALMKLQKEKPQVLKLADALSITQENASATVSFALPASEVVAIVKADAAHKAAKQGTQE